MSMSDAHIEITQYIVETKLSDIEISKLTGCPVGWITAVREEIEPTTNKGDYNAKLVYERNHN